MHIVGSVMLYKATLCKSDEDSRVWHPSFETSCSRDFTF